jgi:hypothetical protein
VAALGRADVPRDGYGRRDIIGDVTVEEPARLTHQLTKLADGLLALGLDPGAVLAFCRRRALDSMPQPRRKVLVALAAGEPLSASELGRRQAIHRQVVRRSLEELHAIGLCRGEDEDEEPATRSGRPRPWRLDGADAPLIAKVVAGAGDDPKCVDIPHLTPFPAPDGVAGEPRFGTGQCGASSGEGDHAGAGSDDGPPTAAEPRPDWHDHADGARRAA